MPEIKWLHLQNPDGSPLEVDTEKLENCRFDEKKGVTCITYKDEKNHRHYNAPVLNTPEDIKSQLQALHAWEYRFEENA